MPLRRPNTVQKALLAALENLNLSSTVRGQVAKALAKIEALQEERITLNLRRKIKKERPTRSVGSDEITPSGVEKKYTLF
jgi:hypothetical protein